MWEKTEAKSDVAFSFPLRQMNGIADLIQDVSLPTRTVFLNANWYISGFRANVNNLHLYLLWQCSVLTTGHVDVTVMFVLPICWILNCLSWSLPWNLHVKLCVFPFTSMPVISCYRLCSALRRSQLNFSLLHHYKLEEDLVLWKNLLQIFHRHSNKTWLFFCRETFSVYK